MMMQIVCDTIWRIIMEYYDGGTGVPYIYAIHELECIPVRSFELIQPLVPLLLCVCVCCVRCLHVKAIATTNNSNDDEGDSVSICPHSTGAIFKHDN